MSFSVSFQYKGRETIYYRPGYPTETIIRLLFIKAFKDDFLKIIPSKNIVRIIEAFSLNAFYLVENLHLVPTVAATIHFRIKELDFETRAIDAGKLEAYLTDELGCIRSYVKEKLKNEQLKMSNL